MYVFLSKGVKFCYCHSFQHLVVLASSSSFPLISLCPSFSCPSITACFREEEFLKDKFQDKTCLFCHLMNE